MSTDKLEVIQSIKSYFDPYIMTEYSAWLILEDLMEIEHIPIKSIIKCAGEKEDVLRFVISGGGVKLIEREGREICMEICFENEFLSDIGSFHSGEVSDVYIHNFEPLVVANISRYHIFNFYEKSAIGSQLGRILSDRENWKLQQRNLDNLGSKTENYFNFIKKYPAHSLRVPQHFIASYLNMSPQSLSRIRGSRGIY